MVEQPPPSQVVPLPSEAIKEPSKAGDQGKGWRWSKVRKLTRAGLGQMTKARARKPLSRQRSPSWSSLRPCPKRRRPLILSSSHWSAKKTLPQRRLSLRFLSLPFCIFSLRSFFLSLYFFFSLALEGGQFALVHDVLSLSLNEKILLFAFVNLCFSYNVYL